MGLLRRHDGLGGTRYQMREKLLAIGDDFWIETEDGRRAFKVDGKALRLRSTFILESPSGEELFKIQEKKLHVRDTMEVEHDGETAATIKKALITPLRDRFAIEVEGGGELRLPVSTPLDGSSVGRLAVKRCALCPAGSLR